MADFLLSCFHKNPQRRPEAAALLNHRWILNHRRTLRASWTRTQGLKARSGRTDAHASVATVVERILQVQFPSIEAGCPASTTVKNRILQIGAIYDVPHLFFKCQSRKICFAGARRVMACYHPQAAESSCASILGTSIFMGVTYKRGSSLGPFLGSGVALAVVQWAIANAGLLYAQQPFMDT
jgi:hypothetical protein